MGIIECFSTKELILIKCLYCGDWFYIPTTTCIANSSSTSFLVPCQKISKNIQQTKNLVYGRKGKQKKYHMVKCCVPKIVHKRYSCHRRSTRRLKRQL